MIRGVAAISAAALLLACGASSRVIRGPDGTPWYEVECRHTADCLEEAAAICPAGYIVGQSGSTVKGVNKVGNAFVAVTQHEMFMRCAPRASAPPQPEATSGLVPYRPTSDPGF
jgi:hypothetical protein